MISGTSNGPQQPPRPARTYLTIAVLRDDLTYCVHIEALSLYRHPLNVYDISTWTGRKRTEQSQRAHNTMASYSSPREDEAEAETTQPKKIAFRFCREWW